MIVTFVRKDDLGMSALHQTEIGYTVQVSGTVPEIVEGLTLELKKRGFGVLSNIDVSRVIKEKIGEEMSSYVILDVCNPRHAKRALDSHKEVGLILPCKITVFEDKSRIWVSLYRPTEALKVLGFSDLDSLAEEVEKELEGALDAIAL